MSLGTIAFSKLNNLMKNGGVGYDARKFVLPETKCVAEEAYGVGVVNMPVDFNFQDGETYTVTINGEKFVCVGICPNDSQSFLGNLGLHTLEGEDTGEPFLMACAVIGGALTLQILFEAAGPYTVSIYTGEVHQIKPKYLPEGGVGYTEMAKEPLYTFSADVLTPDQSSYVGYYDYVPAIKPGETCYVVYGGKTYECVAYSLGGSAVMIGDKTYAGKEKDDPFGIMIVERTMVGVDTKEDVVLYKAVVHKVDSEYLSSKVIDLGAYGETVSIADTILGLVSTGGGSGEVESVSSFWDACGVDEPLNIKLPYLGGMYFNIPQPVVLFTSAGIVEQISFVVLAYNSGILMDVAVNITNSYGNAIVNVKVK